MVAASKKAAAIALLAAHSAKKTTEENALVFVGERDGLVVAELTGGKVFELFSVDSIRGKDGRDGESIAGKDGEHGRGIQTITQPDDRQLDIELTDGQRLTFVLPAGKDGQDGRAGKDGRDGKDGIGIRGERGERGERGPAGKDGRDGIGIQGPKGDKGEKGDKPKHEWQGTKLRFERPDGSWGEWVDLKGQPGRDGKKGFVLNGSTTGSGTGGDGIQSIVAGTGIAVDNTDPQNPIVSATGASGEGRQEVFIGEPATPIDYPAIILAETVVDGETVFEFVVNVP